MVTATILLALDWAALHDVLRGIEPDLGGEYATLALSLPALVLLGVMAYRQWAGGGTAYGDDGR